MWEYIVFTECRQVKIFEEEKSYKFFSSLADLLAILSWLFFFHKRN